MPRVRVKTPKKIPPISTNIIAQFGVGVSSSLLICATTNATGASVVCARSRRPFNKPGETPQVWVAQQGQKAEMEISRQIIRNSEKCKWFSCNEYVQGAWDEGTHIQDLDSEYKLYLKIQRTEEYSIASRFVFHEPLWSPQCQAPWQSSLVTLTKRSDLVVFR